MQEKHMDDIRENHPQALTSEEMRLIREAKAQLQHLKSFPPHVIEQLLLDLPEQYREMAIQMVAEQFVMAMKWHVLQLSAIFAQAAEKEGMEEEECEELLQGMKASIQEIMNLSPLVNVDTLKALCKLGKLTVHAIGLSESTTLEEAQGWLDDLPVIYQDRLRDEHLIGKEPYATITVSASSETVSMQGNYSYSQSAERNGFPAKYNVPPFSLSQKVQSGASAQRGKILPFASRSNSGRLQKRASPIEVKQSLSS